MIPSVSGLNENFNTEDKNTFGATSIHKKDINNIGNIININNRLRLCKVLLKASTEKLPSLNELRYIILSAFSLATYEQQNLSFALSCFLTACTCICRHRTVTSHSR